jgi:Na+-driven multidrug efflux pump
LELEVAVAVVVQRLEKLVVVVVVVLDAVNNLRYFFLPALRSFLLGRLFRVSFAFFVISLTFFLLFVILAFFLGGMSAFRCSSTQCSREQNTM